MPDIVLPETIVFDLDDTLFAERDYVRSGMAAVAAMIRVAYGHDVADLLSRLSREGSEDVLGDCCRALGLPDEAKTSLLWTYRLHVPDIALDPHVRIMLDGLRAAGHRMFVLTDGRSITQRLKIAALTYDFDGIFVSEEVGEGKPSEKGFRLIEKASLSNGYAYVADNPKKDFIAPNRLGWLTVGLTLRPGSVHHFSPEALAADARPRFWISELHQLGALGTYARTEYPVV